MSREIALKNIREIKKVSSAEIKIFKECLKNSIKNITSWNTESEYQQKKISLLLKDVKKFINFIEIEFNFEKDYPFNEIYSWVEKKTCDECIEYIVSIMMDLRVPSSQIGFLSGCHPAGGWQKSCVAVLRQCRVRKLIVRAAMRRRKMPRWMFLLDSPNRRRCAGQLLGLVGFWDVEQWAAFCCSGTPCLSVDARIGNERAVWAGLSCLHHRLTKKMFPAMPLLVCPEPLRFKAETPAIPKATHNIGYAHRCSERISWGLYNGSRTRPLANIPGTVGV